MQTGKGSTLSNAVIPIVIFVILASGWYALYPDVKSSAVPVKHLPPIKWDKDYASAVTQAKSQNKLIMIDFYTDWCEWCKQLDKDVYTDPKVIEAVGQVAAVKLNAEKDGAALAGKYGVEGYPTIIFIDSDGAVISKIVGYEDPDRFAADVNKALNKPTSNIAAAISTKHTQVPV